MGWKRLWPLAIVLLAGLTSATPAMADAPVHSLPSAMVTAGTTRGDTVGVLPWPARSLAAEGHGVRPESPGTGGAEREPYRGVGSPTPAVRTENDGSKIVEIIPFVFLGITVVAFLVGIVAVLRDIVGDDDRDRGGTHRPSHGSGLPYHGTGGGYGGGSYGADGGGGGGC
ncbi:hypothetical protein GCM10010106_18070 [Thermopolyspora flexuosa]|jgi:hypothetical protein|uniref:Uncharacterized protein n=2 Tax=Thermopolyspora flexuosa TaxID=103836 RepID=A0A543J461_9ACTN|nr:hypothetical protein FHX40_4377 [Thermopolyspora flexuosa]GGM72126.1 hypothetical protein GCM10010106_18070 [Thermopolyspora flexuosa]